MSLKGFVFVTGSTGFIGKEVVKALASDGHKVVGLSRNPPAKAEHVNIEYVKGDLLNEEDSAWKERAKKAAYIIHLAQPAIQYAVFSFAKPGQYGKHREIMDKTILDVAGSSTSLKQLVYVAPPAYYGDTGSSWKNEDITPNPRGLSKLAASSVEYVKSASLKVPIIFAFPGYVYGPGSWFKGLFLDRIMDGKPVPKFAWDNYTSFVHVEDCARALIILLQYGRVRSSYFIADTDPATRQEFIGSVENTLGTPVSTLALPSWILNPAIGQEVVDMLSVECKLINFRLKQLGFAPKYPTIKEGLKQVIGEYKNTHTMAVKSGIAFKILPIFVVGASGFAFYKYYLKRDINVDWKIVLKALRK